MTAATFAVFTVTLQDEAPVIGCGLRFVLVKEGRKWVYVLSPFTMRMCRMSITTWRGIHKTEETSAVVIRRILAALAASIERSKREPTKLEKKALALEGEKT